MSGNLPYLCYSHLKTFFNATTCTSNLIYYAAWNSTSLVLQFNSSITKETKWKLNHFSQTLLLTVTLKNCFCPFKMMVNIQIHYMRGSMWRPATSLHTLYLRPLPIRECGISVEHHSYSCWRWMYLFLKAIVELWRKGYAMVSNVEKNDFDICPWSYRPVSEPLFWLLISYLHWPCWSKKLKHNWGARP